MKENIGCIVSFVIIVVIIVFLIIGMNQLIELFHIYDVFLSFNKIVFAFSPLYFLLLYCIERIKLKKIENRNIIHEIDLNYYRDIIENYSPGILSLIYDGRISFHKDLLLSILYLKNKDFIKIENNEISLTGKKDKKLNSNLKIILEYYDVILKRKLTNSDGKMTKAGVFRKKWRSKIYEEAVKLGLVQERRDPIDRYFLIIILLLEFIFWVLTFNENYWGIAITALVLLIYIIMLNVLAFSWNQYPKTQKGYEVYVKLKGLKNFMKDYTNISNKSLEEIEIWEDYFIYEIMFNNDKNINVEARIFYKMLKEKKNKKVVDNNNNNNIAHETIFAAEEKYYMPDEKISATEKLLENLEFDEQEKLF